MNGRYRVQRVLGTGSFGRVYLAEDIHEPGSLLAVKELLAMEFPTAEEQRDAMTWFKREVSALLTLDHPGIPAMQGYWTAQRNAGPLYLAMDYIPGKTLAELQIEHGGKVPRVQALTWGVALCGVLEYLHSRTPSMIFRDLKPSNVLIDSRTQRPVLIDFGLARQMTPVAATAVGTWGYVPFEQVLGRPEPRSDLYALGALLHGMISGTQPDAEYRRLMRGGLDLEGCLKALFPPLDELLPGTPRVLSEAIARATAFALEDRFPDAQAMATALNIALENPGGLVMQGPVAGSVAPRNGESSAAQPMAVPKQPAGASSPANGSGGPPDHPGPPSGRPSPDSREVGNPESGRAAAPRPPAPALSIEAAAMLETIAQAGRATQEQQADPAYSSSHGIPIAATPLGDDQPAGRTGASAPNPEETGPDRAATPGGTGGLVGPGTRGGRREIGRDSPESRDTGPLISVPSQVIRVSPQGGAALRSIAEAIRVAPAGARIEVEPGEYGDPLVVDKPLELVGMGQAGDVVIEVTGATCLLLQAEQVGIRHLTFRGRTGENGARFHTINIPTGRVLLEDCHIISQALACVNIHGPAARPILRRLVLRNSLERALVIYDRTYALIEECDIQGGTYPVRVSAAATPLFRHCRIHHGRFGGVWVAEHGRGAFEDCDIVDNGHHGVVVRQAGHVTLTHCRVQRNG
ncbi:MAG: protein kinase domain-containing protein, partial [Chloroflexota bacterium]